MRSRRCQQCSAESSRAGPFCPWCGGMLDAGRPDLATEPSRVETVGPATARPVRRPRGRALLVAVLVLMTVGGSAAMVFWNASREAPQKAVEDPRRSQVEPRDEPTQSQATSSDEAVGAGTPFSTTVRRYIGTQYDVDDPAVDTDEGRCEVLWQVYLSLPYLEASPGWTVGPEEAEEVTSEGGILHDTIASWVEGNEEALSAVEECAAYFIGREVPPSPDWLSGSGSQPEPQSTQRFVVLSTDLSGEWRRDVEKVQRWLKIHGYSAGPVDGYYGGQTAASVRAFQRDNRLSQTGAVDHETWEKLRGGWTY